MNILVTGGCGFIGSAVVRHLIRDTSHRVCNVDALTYAGNIESLAECADDARYRFVHGDICEVRLMQRVFSEFKPNAVMHLAAESHVDRSIDGPSSFIQTNVVGTCTLLEAARDYFGGLPNSLRNSFRFHHISTDEVFGDLDGVDALFCETSAYAPNSPYAASKAASDHLVRAWHRTFGLPVIVTNCSNNYGPYHFPEKLIPHIIISALEGKTLPIYGDGQQVRDWLYVEDHARALVSVVRDGAIGETYNVGGRNEKRNLDVVSEICVLLDELAAHRRPPTVRSFKELITFVPDRPGHDRRYAIDASKISRELGWEPAETFSSGLRKTVEWYIRNEAWWRRVLGGNYVLGRLGAAAVAITP